MTFMFQIDKWSEYKNFYIITSGWVKVIRIGWFRFTFVMDGNVDLDC
jgi:hypothetical protein